MQNVELLTDDLRPRRDPFTLRELLLLWGSFTLLLLLWSGWRGYGYLQLSGDRERIQHEVRQVELANQNLLNEAKRQPDGGLAISVEQLRAARREQMLLKQLLADVATSDGFSLRLNDLARYKVDGLWLNSFSFSHGGEHIRLSGFSESPENVPLFLSGLSAGSGFSGYNFDGFELRDSEQDLIEFDVYGPAEYRP